MDPYYGGFRTPLGICLNPYYGLGPILEGEGRKERKEGREERKEVEEFFGGGGVCDRVL